MKAIINFSEVPYDFSVCMKRDCVQAETCLRQLVWEVIPSEIQLWTIINPKYLDTLEGSCPLFRSSTKVRYAKGFIGILENLPYKQMCSVIYHLRSYFPARTYFRVRKGERLLTPAEQKGVLDILHKCGVTQPRDFDTYIEKYNW